MVEITNLAPNCTLSAFIKSVMVSIAMLTISMAELIFVNPGMKVNSQNYRDIFLSLMLMLSAIRHVACDTFVFQLTVLVCLIARPVKSGISCCSSLMLSLARGHVDKLVTGLSPLPHREHGTGRRQTFRREL